MGQEYQYIIDAEHRWNKWAAPKDDKGNFDHNNALTGDDLMDYVDGELFQYLKGFKHRADGPLTIEYKIGEIFDKINRGNSLRDALEKIDNESVDVVGHINGDLSTIGVLIKSMPFKFD
ncbi:MAG: type I restriction enzyme M protein [Paraglaciecola sp.]|jgi:type I restriction enzyme M protein